MHTTANTIRDGSDRVLNYFRLRLTSGVIEGVTRMVQAARAQRPPERGGSYADTGGYLIAGDLDSQFPVVNRAK